MGNMGNIRRTTGELRATCTNCISNVIPSSYWSIQIVYHVHTYIYYNYTTGSACSIWPCEAVSHYIHHIHCHLADSWNVHSDQEGRGRSCMCYLHNICICNTVNYFGVNIMYIKTFLSLCLLTPNLI